MKKPFYFLLAAAMFLTTQGVHAQFRSLPSQVTDSFKVRYPNAKQVSWSDKLSYWQASFTEDTFSCTAKFDRDGNWQGTTKKISQTALPAAVQDGYSKSKYYNDWRTGNVLERSMSGGVHQFIIYISKGDLQRKILIFSSTGQLLKDGNTL